jgi:DNA primase
VPLIAEDSLREILDAADLVELVRGRVNLVRRGGRWTGRCPFHEERTPSFSIIPPDNRRYYCHGCGATGDAVRWMMEKEGAPSFPEAVEALAERFGVTVRYDRASPEEEARRAADQRRLELLERAAAFYAEYLWRADEAAPAREYLERRGFGEELLRRYRVGYAPAGGAVLSGRAIRQGFSRDQLAEAGLARIRGGGRAADFFTARITFPITDLRGRVQGFGARTLDPRERAKYVNSPEGPRFSKRRLLFGLAQARQAAARAGVIVVVEGYTDVLALAKAGVEHAVACMGTSLTIEQVRELRRAAPRIRLCFDSDAAGERAAWRTAQAAGEHLADLEAVVLPPGRDPGDMASGDGLDALRALVDDFVSLVTFCIRSRAGRAGGSPSERERAMREIAGLLASVPDSVEKDEGVRVAAGLLQLSRGMEDRLREASRHSEGAAPAGRRDLPSLDAERVRERRLLALAAALPSVAPRLLGDVPEEAVAEPAHREALGLLRAGEPPERWPESLQGLGVALRADPAAAVATEAELQEVVRRIQLTGLERRAAALRERGDDEAALHVLDLVHRLRAALRGEG